MIKFVFLAASIFTINNLSAGPVEYKCEINYEYSLASSGELKEGKRIYKGEKFHIERPSGTVLGGGLGNHSYPKKMIIDPGSKQQNFKLLYLSKPILGTENGKNAVYIEVNEYAETYEKPFVAVTNTKVLSGICI